MKRLNDFLRLHSSDPFGSLFHNLAVQELLPYHWNMRRKRMSRICVRGISGTTCERAITLTHTRAQTHICIWGIVRQSGKKFSRDAFRPSGLIRLNLLCSYP